MPKQCTGSRFDCLGLALTTRGSGALTSSECQRHIWPEKIPNTYQVQNRIEVLLRRLWPRRPHDSVDMLYTGELSMLELMLSHR